MVPIRTRTRTKPAILMDGWFTHLLTILFVIREVVWSAMYTSLEVLGRDSPSPPESKRANGNASVINTYQQWCGYSSDRLLPITYGLEASGSTASDGAHPRPPNVRRGRSGQNQSGEARSRADRHVVARFLTRRSSL